MDFTDGDSDGDNNDLWLQIYNNNLKDQVNRLQQSKIAAEASYVENISRLEKIIQGKIVQLVWVWFVSFISLFIFQNCNQIWPARGRASIFCRSGFV